MARRNMPGGRDKASAYTAISAAITTALGLAGSSHNSTTEINAIQTQVDLYLKSDTYLPVEIEADASLSKREIERQTSDALNALLNQISS